MYDRPLTLNQALTQLEEQQVAIAALAADLSRAQLQLGDDHRARPSEDPFYESHDLDQEDGYGRWKAELQERNHRDPYLGG